MTAAVESRSRRRGAIALLVAQWGRYALQVGGIVLLARLVAPDEFGLVALGAALAGLAAVLGDFGLSLAALRAPTLSPAQRDNLFWINTVVGLVAAGLVVALAAPLAALYGDERLVVVMGLLAPAFALRAASVQFRVELNRTHRLERLAVSEFAGDALGLVVAAALALAGAGYVGLALQGTVAALLTLVLAGVLSGWRPGRPRRDAEMRGLLSFGGNTFATHVLNYASANVGTIVIGQQFGNGVVGFFGRANQLVNLPIDQLATPLTRIVVPRLVDAVDADDLLSRLRRFQTVLCYPVLAYLSVFVATAEPAIVTVLGSAWRDAAPYVPVLAIGALFQTLGYVGYWGFVSRDRSGMLLISEAAGRIAMIALAVALVPLGPLWVAAALAVGHVLIWLVATTVFLPRAGLDGWALAAPGIRPVVIFGTAGLAGWGAASVWAGAADDLTRLVIGVGAWAAAALMMSAVCGRGDLRTLRELVLRR
ncbi:MAG: hypothetical protein FJW64_01685 [Actinobacteria bacterium]|nr:hypothetical protein [Actinomycetota bacterium]